MVFQFKIELGSISDPSVWRRLTIPAQFNFHRFHMVIQMAFGWENYHLYQFSPKGYGSHPIIGIPDPGFASSTEDGKRIKLFEIFHKPKQKFIYIYDFGDNWKHQISLEKIIDQKFLHADCIDGEGACPPEDCGGPSGYENLKTILADPKNPEHPEIREWLGLAKNATWNAHAFDLGKASAAVRKI